MIKIIKIILAVIVSILLIVAASRNEGYEYYIPDKEINDLTQVMDERQNNKKR